MDKGNGRGTFLLQTPKHVDTDPRTTEITLPLGSASWAQNISVL